MKLYAVSDGPPSLACRMVLKALNIPFELIPVNFNTGEHLTDEYFKVENMSKSLPSPPPQASIYFQYFSGGNFS